MPDLSVSVVGIKLDYWADENILLSQQKIVAFMELFFKIVWGGYWILLIVNVTSYISHINVQNVRWYSDNNYKAKSCWGYKAPWSWWPWRDWSPRYGKHV